MIDHITCTR